MDCLKMSIPNPTVKDYLLVISFFLRVLFASAEDLGWDPTMTAIEDANDPKRRCYDITVRSETGDITTYRTVGFLSLAAAEPIHGRATRVWDCNPLDEKGNPVVDEHVALKDIWTDIPRPREGHVYQRINRLAQNSGDVGIIDALKQTLLTVVCHGEVYIRERPDYTREFPEDYDRYKLAHLTDHQKQERSRAYASQMDIKAHTGTIHAEMPRMPEYHRKVHYRIVFREVGTPLRDVTSLHKTFWALWSASAGALCILARVS